MPPDPAGLERFARSPAGPRSSLEVLFGGPLGPVDGAIQAGDGERLGGDGPPRLQCHLGPPATLSADYIDVIAAGPRPLGVRALKVSAAHHVADELLGEALRLRELLKFEFFFSEREPFLREMEREWQLLARERAAKGQA